LKRQGSPDSATVTHSRMRSFRAPGVAKVDSNAAVRQTRVGPETGVRHITFDAEEQSFGAFGTLNVDTQSTGANAACIWLPKANVMDIALETSLISAGTSFIVLLVGQVFTPIIRDWIKEKAEAKYLAIRVVCLLDKFVEDCASTASDNGEEDNEGVTYPTVDPPPPPTFPTDVNWKSISSSTMYKILALPASTERAASYIRAVGENSFPPDYSEVFEARAASYSNLGLATHQLTEELRKKYDIGPAEFRNWDPIENMQRELKELLDLRKKRIKNWGSEIPPQSLTPTPSPSERTEAEKSPSKVDIYPS